MKQQFIILTILYSIINSAYLRNRQNHKHHRLNSFGFAFPSFPDLDNFGGNEQHMTSSFSSFSSSGMGFMGGNNTYSKSFSKSFSSSDINGVKKEEGMETEEYRNKNGDKPIEIRKYGEIFKKNNTNPAILMKRAKSNLEEENLFLDKPEVEQLDYKGESVINYYNP